MTADSIFGEPHDILRVATYNIHKGVQGVGPTRRLEIHNLALAIETLDADIVCLQEVRQGNRKEASYFTGWPKQPQAEFLAPEGYEAVYRSNAVTKHGEHGNALLSRWPVIECRHEDMSDHRFEQRGLLHAKLLVAGVTLHAIVVHFGLIPSSRVRQTAHLKAYIAREIPLDEPVVVAGDFNDWAERLDSAFARAGLVRAHDGATPLPRPTFPSIVPVFALDRIYTRGFRCISTLVPRGTTWARMSDHLPLVAELRLA